MEPVDFVDQGGPLSATCKVAIVIPVFNRKNTTLKCLSSLARIDTNGIDLKIIVVDDGSTDGTSQAIFNDYPQVILIETDGNLWWPGAINLGITKALSIGSDYVLLLNDDTYQEQSFLIKMLLTCKSLDNVICGALILSSSLPDEVMYAGADWARKGGWYYPDRGRQVGELDWDIKDVNALNGNCTLIPSVVFKKIGLMNTKLFPHDYADTEFMVRAKKNGFRLQVNRKAIVWNEPDKIHLSIAERSRKEFIKKFIIDRKYRENIMTNLLFFVTTAPSFDKRIIAIFNFLKMFIPRMIVKLTLPEKIQKKIQEKYRKRYRK